MGACRAGTSTIDQAVARWIEQYKGERRFEAELAAKLPAEAKPNG